MTAYRFCRTDDIPLLVDALNRCWSPYFPGEPPLTPAGFKRSIRDLQVWCSSSMVAFSGSDPIGVLSFCLVTRLTYGMWWLESLGQRSPCQWCCGEKANAGGTLSARPDTKRLRLHESAA